MRKLVFTLLLLVGPAHAEEWFETPTKAGGRIVLTFQTADWCPKNFFIAYIETTQQDAVYGCWAGVNNRIHVRYNDGTRKIYDNEGWEYKNDKK